MSRRQSPWRVLLAGFAWRALGSRRAAETLLQALSGEDEQNRMLAGMAFVKAGARTIDLIERKVESGELPPDLVRLLPDLDLPRRRELLERISNEQAGEAAVAAREGLEQLQRIHGRGTTDPTDSG